MLGHCCAQLVHAGDEAAGGMMVLPLEFGRPQLCTNGDLDRAKPGMDLATTPALCPWAWNGDIDGPKPYKII